MKVKSFEDLEIWQLARELNKFVFLATEKEPFSKDFRFRDQIRAAAGSTMDNIAEGFERGGNKELTQFLSIAKASNAEVRSQSYRAFDQNYLSETQYEELLAKTDTLSRKISKLIQYIKNSTYKGPKFD
ncbi:MAG: four helix bundle protein [Bacteroidales bacterium]|nr:four helix bundle protein [Bacteroidales bacterium]MCF8390284.1 four helix bundle protein [Bacteroidales bacterium]